MARAIENQAFVAAVNRFGLEGEAVYPGHSVGLDFTGKPLTQAMESAEIQVFDIRKDELHGHTWS